MFDNVLFPIIICVVVVLFVVIVRLFRNKKNQYDERQLLARNAAYKVSFFFLLIYCSVCGLMQILDVKWADAAVQMFLGVILSSVLFCALCVIKDAYFSDSPWQNGELTTLVLYLVLSVCFIALCVISAIKLIMEKRGAEN